MRKIGLALATAAAVIATPAMARDGAVYVGAEFGILKADDTDIDIGTVEDAVTLDYVRPARRYGLGRRRVRRLRLRRFPPRSRSLEEEGAG